MTKKIICVGRGGVGKTSFTSTLTLLLKEQAPLLLIDADSDENLANSLGISGHYQSISEALLSIKQNSYDAGIKNLPLSEKINYLLQQDCLYEGAYYDFLSLGVKWSEGCYCQPNNILKGIIMRLEKNYNFVIIDSPAGIEHVNRRITNSVDYVFILVDPSQKSIEGINKFVRLLKDLNVTYTDIFVVANYRFPDEKLKLVKEKTGFEVTGKIPFDEKVEQLNLDGSPLCDIGLSSPFITGISCVIEKSGILKK